MFISFCPTFLGILLLQNSLELGSATAVRSARGISYASENATDDGYTILLGALLPIHTFDNQQVASCGELRSMSIQLVESMVFAVNMINDDPSLLPNITLAFDIRDTCVSENYALQQGLGYIQSVSNTACRVEGTIATSGVVGAGFSSISLVTANLLGLFEIPQVSYSATSPTLSGDQFRYFFRTIPSDDFQAQVLADIIVHFKWTYVILLHSEDLYGIDGAAAFEKELQKRNPNACIATQISLSSRPPNYKEAVHQMSQPWISNATVVVLFGHDTDANGIFQAIQQIRLTNSSFLPNVTWLGSDSWIASFSGEYYPLAKGMLGIVPAITINEDFDEYFSALHPTNNAQNPWFEEFWESHFNCSLTELNSTQLEECDLDNQTLANLMQLNFVPLLIDAVYALANSIDVLMSIKCPYGTLCPEITNPGGAINGSMLREQLLNISFARLSGDGEVQFDQSGTIREASYLILNLQEREGSKFEFTCTGLWSRQNKLNLSADVELVTGDTVPISTCSVPCKPNEISRPVPEQTSCCFTCEACLSNTISKGGECKICDAGTKPNINQTKCDLLPLSYVMWSDVWGIGIAVLAGIGAIATMTVILVFVIFHKHELIMATSRELSYILLLGILLCYIVPYIHIIKPTKLICGIQRFSIGFCFAISYSALLVKTIRIHRIFNRSSSAVGPIQFINPCSQVFFTLCFIGVQVIISAIWLVVEPPKTILVPTMTTRELRCGYNPYIGVSVSLGYNFLLLILSTYYAFCTRKVPANFNEAKFINVTLYTICIIWLAFVPIHFSTTNFGVLFRTVTLEMGVIFSAGTTLGCLFISKIFILFTKIRQDRNLARMRSQAANLQSVSLDNL